MAAKRADFTYYQNGQFKTVGRYNNLAGGGANEVATTELPSHFWPHCDGRDLGLISGVLADLW